VLERFVVVLGAGGWLGRALIGAGANSSEFSRWGVFGIDSAKPFSDLDDLAKDLANSDAPRTVVNAVGRRHGPDSALLESNVRFVERLAAWVDGAGWSVLHLGSAAEYGIGGWEPLQETDEPHPFTAYGRSKLRATEALSGSLGPSRACVARLFNVLGPNPPTGSVAADIRGRMATARQTGTPPKLENPDTVRDFLRIDDAARLLLGLVPSIGRYPVVNVCSGQGLSWRQVADSLCPPLPPDYGQLPPRVPDVIVGNPALLHSLVLPPPTPTAEELATSLLS
jgi:nucleoside-diphosphate-sugar epimerase